MRHKAKKTTVGATRAKCNARAKAGGPCRAPAGENGLCFFHAHPEKLVELGRQGGRKNRPHSSSTDPIIRRSLTAVTDVVGLLEDTIDQVRRREIDNRAANTIGYLSAIALKALQEATIEARLTHLENIAEWKTDDDSKPFKFVSTGEASQ